MLLYFPSVSESKTFAPDNHKSLSLASEHTSN